MKFPKPRETARWRSRFFDGWPLGSQDGSTAQTEVCKRTCAAPQDERGFEGGARATEDSEVR
jgi:hypothetical protein